MKFNRDVIRSLHKGMMPVADPVKSKEKIHETRNIEPATPIEEEKEPKNVEPGDPVEDVEEPKNVETATPVGDIANKDILIILQKLNDIQEEVQEINRHNSDNVVQLNQKIEILKNENKRLKEVIKEKDDVQPAGRKSKFNKYEKEMKKMRESGSSLAEIADKYGCSIGTANRIVKL